MDLHLGGNLFPSVLPSFLSFLFIYFLIVSNSNRGQDNKYSSLLITLYCNLILYFLPYPYHERAGFGGILSLYSYLGDSTLIWVVASLHIFIPTRLLKQCLQCSRRIVSCFLLWIPSFYNTQLKKKKTLIPNLVKLPSVSLVHIWSHDSGRQWRNGMVCLILFLFLYHSFCVFCIYFLSPVLKLELRDWGKGRDVLCTHFVSIKSSKDFFDFCDQV